MYKHSGREQALIRGLDLLDPNEQNSGVFFRGCASKKGPFVLLEGGQRSQSVAWLLEQAGFQAEFLTGGTNPLGIGL